MLLAVLLACSEGDEVTYTQFNSDTDQLTIQVGTEELLDPVTISLYSTTGTVEIGSATADPGGGPMHHDVGKGVEKPGDRGEDEYDLEGDSADEGLFQLELSSVGDEGETREDTFTIRVWEDDTSSSDDTSDTGE